MTSHPGPGGTPGGNHLFIIGFLLSAVSLYFFFDSVRVENIGHGWITGLARRGGGGHGMMTTSMGFLFVPFLIGVIGLFYDASKSWAWALFWLGLFVIVVEILSGLRFRFEMKSSSLIAMFVMFGAGVGLILRSYRPVPTAPKTDAGSEPNTPPPQG